jgi:hypothetical protein
MPVETPCRLLPKGTSMSTFPITVDATRLFYRFFIIPNVTPDFGHGALDARSVQTLQVSPGDYSLQVQSGVFSDLAFTVFPDGKIDYDVSCDAFLSGRGTSALNLNGFEVTIDASSLSGVPGGGVLLAEIPLTNDDWIQRRSIRLRGDVGIIRSPVRASILPDSWCGALLSAVVRGSSAPFLGSSSRGTEGSNPSPSTGESGANLTYSASWYA